MGPRSDWDFFFATFLGGCAGSTAGGLKTNRLILLWQFARVRFSRLITPNTVAKMKYGQAGIPEKTAETAVLFFGLFMASLLVGSTILLALGLDMVTAITGALTALTNVGPGFGDMIGPAGNFSAISEGAIWVLSFLMLLGRLEIITVLMLFTISFWSR